MEAQVVQDLAANSSELVWDESELSHAEWEARREYIPVWQGRSHGFHDYGKAASQDMVDILDKHLPRSMTDWHCDADCFHFRCDDLEIVIDVASNKRNFILPPKIINRDYIVSRTRIDPLRDRLRDIADREGQQLTHFRDLALAILRILEEVSATLEEWSATDKVIQKAPAKTRKPFHVILDVKKVGVETGSFQLNTLINGNLNSVDQSAHALFGLDLKQICDNIPSTWKVQHVESVLRPDLVGRFVAYREKMRVRLEAANLSGAMLRQLNQHPSQQIKLGQGSKLDALEDLLRPRLTFHGTQRHIVPSIVRYGFGLPGEKISDGVVASPRSGTIFYGRGIYSSPESFYALSYAGQNRTATTEQQRPGLRLFVCATLMGRTDKGGPGVHLPLADGYDSQATAGGGFEYIVYNPAQILPCFVIHLDLESTEAGETMKTVQAGAMAFMEHRKRELFRRRDEVLAPGDLQRLREAKKAAASKWFPYGYGPAKGSSFVIEEIGEISDDEENYGDFQSARAEAWKFLDGNDGGEGEYNRQEPKSFKNSALDEYTSARKGFEKVQWANREA